MDTRFFILTEKNKNAHSIGRLSGGSRAVRVNTEADAMGFSFLEVNMDIDRKAKQAWKHDRKVMREMVRRMRSDEFLQEEMDSSFKFFRGLFFAGVFAAIIFGLLMFVFHGTAHAEVSDDLAVKAIMGEASNQGYDGMLAVACAIRNRGHLRGVFGVRAKHIYKEPKWVWDQARKAWKESAKRDVTCGADHWENTKAFGTPKWAHTMKLVYVCKDHNFYKAVR